MKKRKTGFTLIEMMIVVAIIGILAGVMINVININRIQARSRDSRRIGDLKSIQAALELYFSNNRTYPPQGAWILAQNISGFSPDYMATVPLDPKISDTPTSTCFTSPGTYGYYYKSLTGGKYILGATMELDTSTEGSRCNGTDTINCNDIAPPYSCNTTDSRCYCVQNPL